MLTNNPLKLGTHLSKSQLPQQHHILTCHECKLVLTVNNLSKGQKASCSRCGYVLVRYYHNAIDSILALSITAIIFLLASLPFDFLSFKSNGLESSMNIPMSFSSLIEHDYWFLAVVELITIYLIPATLLIIFLYLFIPLKLNRYPKNGHLVMKWLFKILPWSMVEIFLVGAFVSLIKLISLADVTLGPSFYAFLFFSIAMTASILYIDKQALTQMLDTAKCNTKLNSKALESNEFECKESNPVNNKQQTHNNITEKNQLTNSDKLAIQKTWALIITSIILFVPANILPIMNTRLLGQDDPSTILGGVILLWELGSIPIAFVIFIASIVVPVSKIIALIWLNYSIQTQSEHFRKERVKLYRLAEFVGRWSMVDVFVVIILASLIQLGNTMSVYPGVATISFSGVVIITMLAAMSFDPKLIWKSKANSNADA